MIRYSYQRGQSDALENCQPKRCSLPRLLPRLWQQPLQRPQLRLRTTPQWRPPASCRMPPVGSQVRPRAGRPLEADKGSGSKCRVTAEEIRSFTKQVMAGAVQTKVEAAKAPAGDAPAVAWTCCPGPRWTFDVWKN